MSGELQASAHPEFVLPWSRLTLLKARRSGTSWRVVDSLNRRKFVERLTG